MQNSVIVLEILQDEYTQYIVCTAGSDINICGLSGSVKGSYVYANPDFQIGCQKYPRLYFVLCGEEPLTQNIARIFKSDLEERLLRFNSISVYADVEMTAIASLFSAGGLVNKLLHSPLYKMRVARFEMPMNSSTSKECETFMSCQDSVEHVS